MKFNFLESLGDDAVSRVKQVAAKVTEDVTPKVQKTTRKAILKVTNDLEKSTASGTPVEKVIGSLNSSKSFSSISTRSIKRVDPRSDITFFKKPVTIELLKNDVYLRYTKEFEDLTGIKLKENEVKILAEDTPRFKDIKRLENEMQKAGSEHCTIYGAILDSILDYSGFILGTAKVNKEDPAAKLMLSLLDALKGTIVSGEQFNKLEDAILNQVPNKKTYIYSSDRRKSNIGGYYKPDTGLSFINTNTRVPNDLPATLIHEALSHDTDKVIPPKVALAYRRLLQVFGVDKSRVVRKDSGAAKWLELRATLNELKNKLAPDGSILTLLKKVAEMDTDQLLKALSATNGYGKQYVKVIQKNDKRYFDYRIDHLKKAILTLPVGFLAVLFGLEVPKSGTEEVLSAKHGGIIKALDGTKFLIIEEEPDLDEVESNYEFISDYEAQDLDKYLTRLCLQGRIKQGHPDEDALNEIQRTYNLDRFQVQKTLNSLIGNGLGQVLVTQDLPYLEEGGNLIPKNAGGGFVNKILNKISEKSSKEIISKSQKVLDPWEIFVKRAKSKGVSNEELNAIKHFNLNTEEGRLDAAKYLLETQGKDVDFTDAEAIQNYANQLYELSISPGGFGDGMAWNDLKMVHVDDSELPANTVNWVKAHETEHALHFPEEAVPEDAINWNRLSKFLLDYFGKYAYDDAGNVLGKINNTEIGARIGQVLNNAGITDARKFSGSQLKSWFEKYMQDMPLQNEMYSLYKSINNWDSLAKWASNPKNVYVIPGILLGGATLGAAASFGETPMLEKGGPVPKKKFGLILLDLLEDTEETLKEWLGSSLAKANKESNGRIEIIAKAKEAALYKKGIEEGWTKKEVEDREVVTDIASRITRQDVIDLISNLVPKKEAKGNLKKATVFNPKNAKIKAQEEIFEGEEVHIDITDLTSNGSTQKNKVSTVKSIKEATNYLQTLFGKTGPIVYKPSLEPREAGRNGSKGSLVPTKLIKDSELEDFKKQILVPTAEMRGADLDQLAYLRAHGTAGITEKADDRNLTLSLSTLAGGYARLNESTIFNNLSGAKIKSLLVHENLGHGLEKFLSSEYKQSFQDLPGLDSLSSREVEDVRALMMEAKFFLWRQAKKVSGKSSITPEELNEFISKVPEEELKKLFSVLNHQGKGAKGTGTTIANKISKNPTQYKKVLGTMLGASPIVAGAVALASQDDQSPVSELKKGGSLVLKFDLGKVIQKVADVATSGVRTFTASGRLKEFGAETAQKLWTSAKATGDHRLFNLAAIANKSRINHIAYPEEFVNYVDSILKTPTKKTVDTKTTKVLSSDGVTAQKTQNTEFVFGENPETKQMLVIEIPKAPTTQRKTIHGGEKNARTKNTFVRKTITKRKLPEKSEDIDLALKAFLDILHGKFKVSEKMIQDIYSKSYGKMSNYLDEAVNTSTVRHEFNFEEYPQILMHQITEFDPIIPSDTYGLFNYQNVQRVRNMFLKLEAQLAGHTIVPVVITPEGSPYAIAERIVGNDYNFKELESKIYESGYKQGIAPDKIKEAFENYKLNLPRNSELAKLDTLWKFHTEYPVIAGAGDPFVVQYAFKNPASGKLTPIPKLEEHHALALAEQMARAYLKNPLPLDPTEMLNLYKGLREVDFLNRFLLLTKEQHTGKIGIHYADEFTLLDLGRIKNLARIGNFNDLNDLLDFYRSIVAKRKAYFKFGGNMNRNIKLLKKHSVGGIMDDLLSSVVSAISRGNKNVAETITSRVSSGAIKIKDLENLVKRAPTTGSIILPRSSKYKPAVLTSPGTAPYTFNGKALTEITSPNGAPVTKKFYTELGSEYILAADGSTQRIKSVHANTGGSDIGLHDWNQKAFFTLGEEGKNFNMAGFMLMEKGMPFTLSALEGKLQYLLYDGQKWRPAMMSDVYPKAVQQGIPDTIIATTYSKDPLIGSHILEIGTKKNNIVNKIHPGSEVSYIEKPNWRGKVLAPDQVTEDMFDFKK